MRNPNELTRRQILQTGAAGLGILAFPEWALPALAPGEELVPFTDIPEGFSTVRGPDRRVLDLREIDGPFTPGDQFFTTQHYGHPTVDGEAYRLKVSGLVDHPKELTLDEIRKRGTAVLDAGFECSGNSARSVQGLVSNGRWTGLPLRDLLKEAGVQEKAREAVFFGLDRGTEEVEFRGRKFPVEQQYGRSLPLDVAISPEPFLAHALNGEPLSVHQGFPLRLIVPGWYGAPNVKWLSNIHLQQDPFIGKYQALWYRTLKGEMIGGELKWTETAITRMRVKSAIARVSRTGDQCKILGFALTDGTPLRSVEVKIDDSPWQPAAIDSSAGEYSWKLFTYDWVGASAGAHTLVSRATDANGEVQPTAEELENKKTFLEDNAQYPRTVTI
jgi:DMSO/TMAO reductase YedYZ molybdopterin-dependent catalytic subunit